MAWKDLILRRFALPALAGGCLLFGAAVVSADDSTPPPAPRGLHQVDDVLTTKHGGPIVEQIVPQPMRHYQPQSTWHGVPTDQLFRLRGGLSYYDSPGRDAKVGGTWGLDGIIPLSETFGGYGAGKMNHFSGGTQYYVSGGLYKMADPWSDGLLDRIGGAALYDWFSDSRGTGLDLSMYRFYLGYALSENWSVGARYITPGDGDTNPLFYNNVTAGTTGNFQLDESVAGYLSGYMGQNLVSVAVGYRDSVDTVFIDASIRRPIARNLYVFADTHYEDRGGWAAITGLEFRFGPGGGSDCGCGRRLRTPWDDPTLFDAFNWGEARTMGTNVTTQENGPAPPSEG